MSKDTSYTYVHFLKPLHADLFEEFNRPPHLPHESIYVPPEHQPPNPEDEDDVVPDQHAAFGITQATQANRAPVWKDLGLERLLDGGPLRAVRTGKAPEQATAIKAAKMGVGIGAAGRALDSLPR